MNNIAQFVVLFLIALFSYKIIDSIFSNVQKRKYKVRLKSEQDEEPLIKENRPFFYKYKSFDNYKNHIEELMKKAQLNSSFEQFNLKRIINAFVVGIMIIALYFYTKQSLLLLASPILAIVMFQSPVRSLEKFSRQIDNEIQFEAVDYLYHFLILLKTYTPLEATMKSVSYAGSYIKPKAEEMVSSLIVQPNNFKPYHQFAESIDSQEVREFAHIIEQINKLDSSSSLALLERQAEVMQELQEEYFKELVKTKPLVSEKLSNYLLFAFILVIGSVIATIISNTMPF